MAVRVAAALARALLLLLIGSSCSDGSDDGRLLSGTVIRRSVQRSIGGQDLGADGAVDAAPPDAATPDAATPDAATPDAATPDGAAADGAAASDAASDGGSVVPPGVVTLARRGDILCSTSSGVAVLGAIDSFTGNFDLTAPPDEILACWRIDASGRLYPVLFLDGFLALPPARTSLALGAIFPSDGFFVSPIAAADTRAGQASGDPAAVAGDYDLQVDDGTRLGLRLVDRGADAADGAAGRWLLVVEDSRGDCAQAIRAQVQRYDDQLFVGALQGDGDASTARPEGSTQAARFRLGLNGVVDGDGAITGYLLWLDDHPDLGFTGPQVQAFVLVPRGTSTACPDLDSLLADLPPCADGCELDGATGICLGPGQGPCDVDGPVLARACPEGCAVNELALCWDARVGAACCLDASWCPGSCFCQRGYCVEPDDPGLACQQ